MITCSFEKLLASFLQDIRAKLLMRIKNVFSFSKIIKNFLYLQTQNGRVAQLDRASDYGSEG